MMSWQQVDLEDDWTAWRRFLQLLEQRIMILPPDRPRTWHSHVESLEPPPAPVRGNGGDDPEAELEDQDL